MLGYASPRRPAPRQLRLVELVPVEAKLRIPVQRPGLVGRPAVMDRLARYADAPVVVVSAPAGYGKTTLLSQLAAAEHRPVSWLSLEMTDDDPVELISYVLLALQRVESIDADVGSALRGDETTILTVALPRLGRMLLERRRPFVLVLDDADVITSDICLQVLTTVIQHLPAGSQLVIGSRSDLRLPWGRLESRGSAVRIGPEQLRMSVREGGALLAEAGLQLASDDVLALVERTEGWPAGLYLAALTVAEDGGDEKAVQRFTGDERLLMDYLRDELLTRASPDEVHFLTRTSILSKLSAGLCDEVLGRDDSGKILRDLAAANLFLAPLDGHVTWYRFHDLFARMLRAELASREPRLEPELHRRAGAWWEARGDIEEAIRHARAVGDVSRAARLLWSLVPWYITSGRRARLERLLDDFHPAEVYGEPWVSLSTAWWALPTGRPLDDLLAAAERATRAGGRTDPDPDLVAAVALLRALLGHEGIARMRADAEVAEHHQQAGDPWRVMCQFLIAMAAQLTGDRPGAWRLHEQNDRLAAGLALPQLQALSGAEMALLAVEQGDWATASTLTANALDILEASHLDKLPTMGPVFCVAALVLAQRGELAAARREARRGRLKMASTDHFAPWWAVQARLVLARAQLLLGDTVAARVLLTEARPLIAQVADAPVLFEWLGELEGQVDPLEGSIPQSPSALTTAEIRVLRLLPTHLSLEEISKRLHVSRNTVKTQARAIRVKLGVSSRAGVVERARSLGLLDAAHDGAALTRRTGAGS